MSSPHDGPGRRAPDRTAAPGRPRAVRTPGASPAAAAQAWPTWLVVLVVAAGYSAGSLVSFLLFQASTAGAVFFPPAGVSFAALVLTPRRQWPWVLATVAVAEMVLDVSQGQSWHVVWGFALANTVEPFVSATLVRRLVGRPDLSRRHDLGVFVLAAMVIGPMVGGLIGATTIAIGLGGSWIDGFPPFWAGDALGVLTVAGTVLTWSGAPRRGERAFIVQVVSATLVTALVTVLAFLPRTVPLAYLPIPLLFAVAFRYGVVAVAASGLAMTLAANVMTAAGRGSWAGLADTPNAEIATLQVFLGVAILGAWALAVEINEEQRTSRAYAREHEAAHQLQRALLPHVPEVLPGAAVAASYRPADEQHDVGGDWYDVYALGEDRLAVVVGDVIGHDLQAAATMGRLNATLRAITSLPHTGPAQVLALLDRACVDIPGAPSSTVGYGEYDAHDGLFRYACAGHPPPLLVHDRTARYLPGGRSPVLGLEHDAWEEAELTIPPGAMLVWYSDGLVERRTTDIDTGLDRLAAVAAGLDPAAPPQSWCDAIIERLTDAEDVEDDLVLICLRLDRSSDPRTVTDPAGATVR